MNKYYRYGKDSGTVRAEMTLVESTMQGLAGREKDVVSTYVKVNKRGWSRVGMAE